MSGDFPLARLNGRRVVFVSLGKVASDHSGFYCSCFEAFVGTDWLVVAATGRTDPVELQPMPANVVSRPFVPQIAVLERARAFVSHGGMNATMEALWLGVPLVVVPQLGDQPLVAERITALGLGQALSPDGLTGLAIRDEVERVVSEPEIAHGTASMRNEMRAAGSAAGAAEAVRHYVGEARKSILTGVSTDPVISSAMNKRKCHGC